jgi:hypothetical protein
MADLEYENMDPLALSSIHYRTIRDQLTAEEPQIDEETLADTVEGLSDPPDILTAILRAALTDEAMAQGLKARIIEMEGRLSRLQERSAKRRKIVKITMMEAGLKKLTAADFSASIRDGVPGLRVIDEAAVPSIYWEPRTPRLNRQDLISDLKKALT